MQHTRFRGLIAALQASGLAVLLALPTALSAQQTEVADPLQPDQQASELQRQADDEAAQSREQFRQEESREQDQQQQDERAEQAQQDRSERQDDRDAQDRERSAQQRQQSGRGQQRPQGQASLGIAIAETPEGVAVLRVYPGSAAQQAGLREGDRIERIGEQQIDSANSLIQAIGQRQPGDRLQVTIVRGDERSTVEVRLQSRQEAFGLAGQGGLDPRFDQFERRFRQPTSPPWMGEDLSQHINALEQQIRQLREEIQDLRRMISSMPEASSARQDGARQDARDEARPDEQQPETREF